MKKNWLKQLGKGILAFLLFYFSAFLQLIPIIIFNIENVDGATDVVLNCFSNFILLLVLYFMYRKELKSEWKIFKEKLAENLDIGLKCWLCGLLVMIASNLLINIFFQAGQADNEQAVQSMISSLPWLMVINAGILAPIIEEIVFRKCFRNVLINKWLFIIGSGFVFGLLHVITTATSFSDYLFIVPYGSLGVAFAFAYNKTDTIFTPIALHIFHNTVLVLLSSLM